MVEHLQNLLHIFILEINIVFNRRSADLFTAMLGFLDIHVGKRLWCTFQLVLSMADSLGKFGSSSQPAELVGDHGKTGSANHSCKELTRSEYHERKVRTVPWMLVRQTGQSLKEGAQRTQEQR